MTVGAFAMFIVVKPGLVMTGALVLAWLFRRRTAAARHAIWAGGIGAVLVLPLLGRVLPPIRIRPLADAVVAPIIDAVPSNAPDSRRWVPDNHSAGTMSDSARERDASVRLAEALFSVWGAVALLLVARRLAAELLTRRLVVRGRAPSATVLERAADIARRRGMRRPVMVTISDEAGSPAVAGIFRPTVILPAAADTWTDAETAAVLIHELSHVARRDCVVNLVADLTAAIHWCNPTVHVAVRRIRAEAERACDDEVLHAGAEPGAYALLLLAFARAALVGRALPRTATAMARPSELESRLLAVLDERVPHARARAWVTRALAGVATLLALPIAAATLSAGTAPVSQQVTGPEPDRLGDSLRAQSSERVPLDSDAPAIRAAASRAFIGPDSALATRLLAAANAPSDAASLVRERAAWALLQTRGNRLIEPVLEALDANDWRVQAYAAWTLAVAGDHRAVPKLIPLLRHPVWRLRAMAAAALQSLGDPRAIDAMTSALTDQAWQVRMEAVDYLAAVGGPAQRELLRARLADRHIAVRNAAANALTRP